MWTIKLGSRLNIAHLLPHNGEKNTRSFVTTTKILRVKKSLILIRDIDNYFFIGMTSRRKSLYSLLAKSTNVTA